MATKPKYGIKEGVAGVYLPVKHTPFWKKALKGFAQAIGFSVVILVMASVVSAATGQATLAERIDQNAEKAERFTEAIVCILTIPPDDRTIEDTQFCLRHTRISPEDIPVPPSVEGKK